MASRTYDFVIVGAGIVGLTVARELRQRLPSAKIALLEKEDRLGAHASGRNSGVLHCGIYYGSDTLKAKLCSRGAFRMMAFAEENGIAYRKSGKVILATSDAELPTVERLMRNARDNGIRASKIDSRQLHELEPAAAPGVAAIHCPDTAVIDSPAVIDVLRQQLGRQGVDFLLGTKARGLEGESTLRAGGELLSFGYLFNCAGAHADTVARQFDLAKDYTLVPFKGIYWKLSPEANPLIRANIYPVPDISLPFLGVHLTRVISGDVYIGPTAIPALGRENYGLVQGAHLGEAFTIGIKLAGMYLGNQNNFRLLAHTEIAKYRKRHFLAAAQRLCPALNEKDLVPTAKAGIRPQLVNIKTGKLEMDYIFEQTDHSLHVLNAISPAFTSSFAFAELIVDKSGVAGARREVAA